MKHSLLLCTSLRVHRVNNCCTCYPRSCMCGTVWRRDFSFQNIWVCLSNEKAATFTATGICVIALQCVCVIPAMSIGVLPPRGDAEPRSV